MIDGSEKPNSQLGFELQSSHVTENRNKHLKSQRQTCLTRSHITQYFIDITSLYKSRLLLDENKDLATFLPILFSCTLTFSSFDVVELLGANVNNARTRI